MDIDSLISFALLILNKENIKTKISSPQKNTVFFLFLFLFALAIQGQSKKTLNINRTSFAPEIDGNLDDEAWKNANIATDFISFQPEIGLKRPNNERTEVRITYDNQAIYISAYMYDDPDQIMKQLTARDDFGQSDFFLVVMNPNNDSQNDTLFFVFASGTQADAIANPTFGEDYGWNAVWDSAVKMQDDGWTVEMKIPYRALRFQKQDDPTWGIQFHRHYRKTREQSGTLFLFLFYPPLPPRTDQPRSSLFLQII